ncbi:hypothetical protein L7F22_007795 [Adiantum nelumboides]|nr:hypothetical protein [Adiantum nelumboides]
MLLFVHDDAKLIWIFLIVSLEGIEVVHISFIVLMISLKDVEDIRVVYTMITGLMFDRKDGLIHDERFFLMFSQNNVQVFHAKFEGVDVKEARILTEFAWSHSNHALQQNFTVNNVSCEVIDTKDAPAVEPIDEESINPHLNQQACKEDDKEIQVSKGQPLQLLETKSSDTMEVDDDASSKTCRRTEEDSTKNILVAQDLSTRVYGDPNLPSNDGPTLTIILSLCGLLLRRCWQKSKKMKTLKFEHEYIVLRPGCIEFLKSLLSISNVGIWSATNDTQVMQIIKILEKEAGEHFPFFMIWGQSQCQQCVESRITRPDNPRVEAFFKPLAIASTKFGIDLKRLLLIDDAPLKGCINLALNCIFPPSFNIDEEDNILLGELLPYTKYLHHVNDIRIITRSSLYG